MDDKLSFRQQCLIIAALQACAPSGGGSDAYHLAGQLQLMWGVCPSDSQVASLQMAAYNEVREHVEHTYDTKLPIVRQQMLTRGQ